MSSAPITVLGAGGFVGRHLVAHLQAEGVPFEAPPRDDPGLAERALGHVIYCIGLTADFRTRPHDAAEAHVGLLNRLLRAGRFASLLYLSSTRVYQGAASTCEDAPLRVNPNDPSDLYNLTKLTGESLCLSDPRPTVRAVRLSNVYGCDPGSSNFLNTVLDDALGAGRVRFGLSPASAKDYVAAADVAAILPRLALSGRRRLYNLASGENTDNAALAAALTAAAGCGVEFAPDAPSVIFPPIDVSRLRDEFGWRPRRLLDDLPELVRTWRAAAPVSLSLSNT